ncbi:unnamed protein product [Lecanosticta acicola]|uniref:Unnamed protein product n=1 Tax=Lecanosticta acicola TaxID=111012 RepID=A0AAI9EBS1_9PEZI|nr:unnamed protein product [Lecanosticta acicola]
MATVRAVNLRRSVCAQCVRNQTQRRSYMPTPGLNYAEESRLPRVANPSFWSSLIPRVLRRPTDAGEAAQRAKKRAAGAEERRIGITFLLLGILVGSNAINLISLRREMLNFTRLTDAKLATLREVVKRVKDGEDVDVKKALGTGDPQQEKEWEQVIQELEETDMLIEGRKKREAQRAERAAQRQQEDEARSQSRRSKSETSTSGSTGAGDASRPKFLM